MAASLANCVLALGVWMYLNSVERSPLGRVLRAIRDNSDAAASLGKNVARIRLNVIVAGGIICGLAGAMYTLYTTGVAPSALSRLMVVPSGSWDLRRKREQCRGSHGPLSLSCAEADHTYKFALLS
jgi:ABC-type branched-subunit amino acid transport system permease subunit